jgi:hypothetical protein
MENNRHADRHYNVIWLREHMQKRPINGILLRGWRLRNTARAPRENTSIEVPITYLCFVSAAQSALLRLILIRSHCQRVKPSRLSDPRIRGLLVSGLVSTHVRLSRIR